ARTSAAHTAILRYQTNERMASMPFAIWRNRFILAGGPALFPPGLWVMTSVRHPSAPESGKGFRPAACFRPHEPSESRKSANFAKISTALRVQTGGEGRGMVRTARSGVNGDSGVEPADTHSLCAWGRADSRSETTSSQIRSAKCQ